MGSSMPLADIDHLRQQTANGSRLGPRIVAAGPILDGRAKPLRPNFLAITTPEEGRDPGLATFRVVDIGPVLRDAILAQLPAKARLPALRRQRGLGPPQSSSGKWGWSSPWPTPLQDACTWELGNSPCRSRLPECETSSLWSRRLRDGCPTLCGTPRLSILR